jgi:hypothetical protein
MQLSRGNRRGANFSTRISEAEREAIAAHPLRVVGPRALGPWLIWNAIHGDRGGSAPTAPPALPSRGVSSGTARVRAPVSLELALPELAPGPGSAPPAGYCRARSGTAAAGTGSAPAAAVPRRRILDLCGGSGAWSAPYRAAGYDVEVVTLPAGDVRAYVPSGDVWGVLAAPPCNEFSILKRAKRDFSRGLETVCACLRIIALARPRWWALENPGSGLLRRWLGPPRETFQPCDYGDAWTKLTALWGNFALPRKSPVPPLSGMPGSTAAERAITPPGFARAFFEANP